MGEQITFDSKFHDASHPRYFYHSIDAAAGVLKVQVLGPNLTQTFHHQHRPGHKMDRNNLFRKTTGFLAAIGSSGKRVILAWAESGHGLGTNGDTLQTSNQILANKLWAKRARQLADALGIKLASGHDRRQVAHEYIKGKFQSSHVEAKLSAHAATLLLRLAKQSGVTEVQDAALTRENLRRLQQIKWNGGHAPHFEVYVSRKNCLRCGQFLDRLQALTGVRFDMRWADRLVPLEYQSSWKLDPDAPAPVLETFEEDGIIYYLPPRDANRTEGGDIKAADQPDAGPRLLFLKKLSLHHLSDVDKPLPATPVTEAPDWDGMEGVEETTESESATPQPEDNATEAVRISPDMSFPVISDFMLVQHSPKPVANTADRNLTAAHRSQSAPAASERGASPSNTPNLPFPLRLKDYTMRLSQDARSLHYDSGSETDESPFWV